MKIIIDEGISASSPTFKSFLQWLGNQTAEFLFLSKEHPGIPDIEIIDKLLPKYHNLLTKDRVLHNRAIAKGFKSFILDENGNLITKSLKNIRQKESAPSVRKEIASSYLLEPSEMVCKLTSRLCSTFSQKYIEKLRTKRRRIRSHFGDVANIASIDITIASKKTPKGVLGGYLLKINAKQALKALMNASEGYCLDASFGHSLSPIFYALSHIFCLHLTHIPITIYILSTENFDMCLKLKTSAEIPDHPIEHSVKLMLQHLTNVDILPCLKGPFFNRMEAKIDQLQHTKTNEIVTADFKAMVASFSPNFRFSSAEYGEIPQHYL